MTPERSGGVHPSVDVEQLRQGLRRRPEAPGPGIMGQEVSRVLAQRSETGRFDPDHREALSESSIEGVERPPNLPAGDIQLTGGNPGQAATHLRCRELDRVAGVLQYAHRGLSGVRAEVLGKGVHPQQHATLA